MNTQETLIRMLTESTPVFFRAAKGMPEDKLRWKPEATSRNAHELVVEVVTMFANTAACLRDRAMTADYASIAAANAARTIAELEEQANTDLPILFEAMRAFPESEFDTILSLPWGDSSFFQIMNYPYWNMMYHFGQISYIQTLYGDKDMY